MHVLEAQKDFVLSNDMSEQRLLNKLYSYTGTGVFGEKHGDRIMV